MVEVVGEREREEVRGRKKKENPTLEQKVGGRKKKKKKKKKEASTFRCFDCLLLFFFASLSLTSLSAKLDRELAMSVSHRKR